MTVGSLSGPFSALHRTLSVIGIVLLMMSVPYVLQCQCHLLCVRRSRGTCVTVVIGYRESFVWQKCPPINGKLTGLDIRASKVVISLIQLDSFQFFIRIPTFIYQNQDKFRRDTQHFRWLSVFWEDNEKSMPASTNLSPYKVDIKPQKTAQIPLLSKLIVKWLHSWRIPSKGKKSTMHKI